MIFPLGLGKRDEDASHISDSVLEPSGPAATGPEGSDAAALGRAHAVVRDRGDVADRGDLEADRLQRPERALAARARALDLDLERADAMLRGLLARILGGDLGGIGRRLAAALEAHHARARPGNRIALRVGDRDHRVVEARIHVGDARGDVLALAPPEALRCLCHVTYLSLYPL